MGWADEARRLKVRANADTPARRAHRARVRRRGHRPLPHRAHVLRRRPHRRGARDDPGRRRGRPARGARQAPADAARRLRRALPRSWTACRSRSACSIRRCTSSCRTTEAEIAEVARRRIGVDVDELQRTRRRAARVQPDARPPRLPPRRSPIPRSTRCRRARSSRRRSRSAQETGEPVVPEIMIPLVAHAGASSTSLKARDRRGGAGGVARRAARTLDYLVGTMIELPRAALLRRRDRRDAPSSSRFGTNDLTQTTLRHLARRRRRVPRRLHRQGHPRRRTRSSRIDLEGVGELVQHRRRARPRDAARHQARHLRRAWRRPGLDRVLRRASGSTTSRCSPYRVPIARLAAAQAALGGKVASQA